ncbi:MAG: dihydropteroate synthase [Candidatus Omnitrophota bacterium]|nr:MAG: dihydropteroate synthase [Candidatus Omnitrophota bacterium]
MKIFPLNLDRKRIREYMEKIGVDKEGIKIMLPKTDFRIFKIDKLSSYAANILKQEALSCGADVAIRRDSIFRRVQTTALVFGTLSQLKKLIEKLAKQPFGLKEVSCKLEELLKEKKKALFLRNRHLLLDKPCICGVINITFDSFSGDGILAQAQRERRKPQDLVLKKAERMIKEGAKIIDLGAESSRPFSKPIKEEEELKRLVPSLKVLRDEFKDIFISVDTYKYKVAKEAISYGADIINDITALRKSPQIISLIKKYNVGCILMHMKGTPQTMQIKPFYRDVIGEIAEFLEERVNFCLKRGIKKEQIMIDPGIGFGKRLEDNLRIINRLDEFKFLNLPVFLGISRKSFIGKILRIKIEERLAGTLAALVLAALKGANILRVHDVKEAVEAIRIVEAVKRF